MRKDQSNSLYFSTLVTAKSKIETLVTLVDFSAY